MKNLILASALAAAVLAPVKTEAAAIDFTYDNGSDTYIYGNKKIERLDVAVAVKNPSLTGMKITGMRVTLPAEEGYYSDLSGWVSSKLELQSSKNVPDLASAAATVEDGFLKAKFSEPVEITDAGLFVGYTLTVKKLADASGKDVQGAMYPITVVKDGPAGSFWFHSSRTTYSWTDINAEQGLASTLIVELEGDVVEYNGNLGFGTNYVKGGTEDIVLKADLYTFGSKEISNIDYTYDINGKQGEGHVDLAKPLRPLYGASTPVSITLPGIEKTGVYEGTVTLSKINGVAVAGNDKISKITINVVSFLPTKRPLVEEYTGLWCGYCPRGFVALENMKEEYGDRFVAIAVHNGDPMTVTNRAPISISGLPYGSINREGMDPESFYTQWPVFAEGVPVADITAAIEWADEAKTTLRLKSNTTFISNYENANFRVGFAIVADGLRNDSWSQKNYYSTAQPGTLPAPYGDLFIGKSSSVKGLTYNDVLCYFPNLYGDEKSLPATITFGTSYEYNVDVPVTEIGTGSVSSPFKNYDMMRAIAIVFDANGNVVNCVSSKHLDYEAGVHQIAIENGLVPDDVKSESFYDLQGRRIDEPAEGIYVKRQVLNDGTVRTIKSIKH